MTMDPTSREDLTNALIDAGCTVQGNTVRCAFHEDGTPSGSIYQHAVDHRWRYRCHACEAQGDVFDIIALATNRPLADVLREHQNPSKRQSSPGRKPIVAGNGSQQPDPRPVTTYATLDDLVSAMKAYATVAAVYTYQAITGEPVLAVMRLAPKAFRQASVTKAGWWQLKGLEGRLPVYRAPQVQVADVCVIVVEGEKDADALVALHFEATTSPMGADAASVPLEQSGKPGRTDWSPLAGKDVVLWPDHDDVGQRHMLRVARELHRLSPPPTVSVIRPEMTRGAKDAAEFIASYANPEQAGDAVEALLDATEPIGPTNDLAKHMELIIEGKLVSEPWPWYYLTHLTYSLRPDTITLLVGSPGTSKSLVTMQAVLFWLEQGLRVAVLALEETREYWMQRALAQISKCSAMTNYKWVKDNPEQVRAMQIRYRAELERYGNAVHTDAKGMSLPDVARWVDEQAAAGGRIIVVDPVTMADEGPERTWEAAKNFMRSIQQSARRYGASVVLVSHGRRSDPKRGLSVELDAVAGGAAYTRFASTVLWLQSHADETVVGIQTHDLTGSAEPVNRTIRVLKARNAAGTGKTIALWFDGETLRTEELGIVSDIGKPAKPVH